MSLAALARSSQGTAVPQRATHEVGARALRPAAANAAATTPARPAARTDGFDNLVKYIPTETITIFVAICSARAAIVTVAGSFSYAAAYAGCAALTPLLLWLIAAGRHRAAGGVGAAPFHWWSPTAATIAFLFWAMSVPGVTQMFGGTEPQQAAWGVLAGIAALLVSLLLSLLDPLFERRPAASPIPPAQAANAFLSNANLKGPIMTDNPTHFCATPAPPGLTLRPEQAYFPKAAALRAALWEPGATITIKFVGGSAALQARVATVAKKWLDHANLVFRFVENGDADIRVAFLPGQGSWSYIGTDCRHIPVDQPTMNFGWLDDNSSDVDVRSVVLHEFGHAIGLIHEHQNPKDRIRWNKDAVVHDLSGPPNNWDMPTIENNMFKPYAESETIASDVDATSIMMYPIPASWTEGGYFSAGFNSTLSTNDKLIAREVYPR